MSKNKMIIPSAPFKNYEDIERVAMDASGRVDRIQIDVCDGKYVPSVSWPFTEIGKGDFEKMATRPDLDVYLPNWEDISYSVDLMIENPEKYIPTFVCYGVDQVFVHFRSKPDWEKIFELVKQFDLDLVLAVDVKTDIEQAILFLEKNMEMFGGVQVMGIENIGFQGQELSEQSLDIVKKIKNKFPEIVIYFDGAINDETISKIAESGVDVFCVGSFLTQSNDFKEDFKILREMI